MAQLTSKEFASYPTGTRAKMIRCFDGNTGERVDTIYILLDDPNLEEELEDAQTVSDGYFTETWNVTRK